MAFRVASSSLAGTLTGAELLDAFTSLFLRPFIVAPCGKIQRERIKDESEERTHDHNLELDSYDSWGDWG